MEAVGVGNFRLDMLFNVSESKQAVLLNVLYVPKLSCNLFSIRASASKGSDCPVWSVKLLDAEKKWRA